MLRKDRQNVDYSFKPSLCGRVHRISNERNGERSTWQHRGAAGEALKGSVVAEPLPFRDFAADDPQTIITLDARMGIPPVLTNHLTPAGDSQKALFRGRIKLPKKPGEVSRGAHKPCRRGE